MHSVSSLAPLPAFPIYWPCFFVQHGTTDGFLVLNVT